MEVNVYSLNGDRDALIHDVRKEILLAHQQSLNGLGWWGINVVRTMVKKDPSLLESHGHTRQLIGFSYNTFANGENNNNTERESGPLLFVALKRGDS